MKIVSMVLGELETNCYLLIDEQTLHAAVIDPADEAKRIAARIAREGATLDYILLTHGHRDHTLAAPALHRLFPEAAVYLHPEDEGGVGTYAMPLRERIPALKNYDEGDTLPLGSLTIEVLHTPGHTAGSVCLRVGGVLFVGDTLFAGSMGRIDLPGAQPEKMLPSLARLAALPGDYDVLPGHMGRTTLARERQWNPFLREAMEQA